MKNSLIYTLILFLICSTCLGSEYSILKTSTNEWRKSGRTDFLDGKLKIEVLDSLDKIYSKNPNSYHFFFEKDVLKILVGCGFDLYSINDDLLELEYNFFNRGYNCGSYPFERDSNIFLLGGTGLWSNHMDLLWFDEIHGSWEFVKTINQPIDYFSFGMFQNSKGIYSLFGNYYNPRIEMNKDEFNGYFLEWENKEWKKLQVKIDGVNNSDLINTSFIRYLETQDYLYIVFTNTDIPNLGWNIIDKESGKIYLYESLKNEDVFLSPFVEVIGNKLFYQSPNGTPKSLDIESLISKSEVVGSISIEEELWNMGEVFPIRDRFYIMTIIILFLITLSLYFRKKTEPISTIINSNNEVEKIIESFSKHSGQLLNTDQLDGILGIDSVDNNDSKRLKRSRWINRLNEYNNSQNGKDLIVRDKNPEDKRYTYYRINI